MNAQTQDPRSKNDVVTRRAPRWAWQVLDLLLLAPGGSSKPNLNLRRKFRLMEPMTLMETRANSGN